MCYLNIKKLANYLIIFLFIILSSLLVFNIYLIINKISKPKAPPRNSIRVSPITGENINVGTHLSITKVNYNENVFELLGYIENASVVYESYSLVNKQFSYSALFHNLDFKLHDSMKIITYENNSSIPNFKFKESNELLLNDFNANASKISISQDIDTNYSFLYYDDKYHKSTTLSNTNLAFDNIVIDDCKSNNVIIFTKGYVKEFSKDNYILLSQGKTYYIYLSSIGSYTYSN
ncbi:MAG: hypothetical protein ACRC2K_04570 [Clostridium sp.]